MKRYINLIFIGLDKRGSLIDGINKIIDARSEATNVLKEFFRYRKIKFNYINIPEISKKEKVHLHMYYYIEIGDEQQAEIKKAIEDRLKNKYPNEQYDVHVKKIDIHNKYTKNYSSIAKNLMEKMKKDPNRAKIFYFFFFKMFGKRRFITYSRVLSFKYLRRTMAFLVQEGIKMSYIKLIKNILNNNDKIKVNVQNKKVNLSLLYYLSRNIDFLFPNRTERWISKWT